jgi:putative FmdB family regulatory protein
MPLYEYECHACGNRFTEMMSVSEYETRSARCPKCESGQTEPLIQAAYVATTKKS